MFGTAVAMLALLAGCGSSNTATTSSTAATTAATTSTAAARPAYGEGGSASSASGSASSAGGSTSGVLVTAKQAKLGAILAAGPKKLTVYLFEGDKGSTSTCSGACAGAWPPVTTTGRASASGSAMAVDLGMITRPDGSKQVTYKGHPLYFFARDKDNGDAYGQGVKAFGADWYVLAPTGKKIDKS
jgi:predicted lipoprotein with Yx(FWY)xxD motif